MIRSIEMIKTERTNMLSKKMVLKSDQNNYLYVMNYVQTFSQVEISNVVKSDIPVHVCLKKNPYTFN